MHVLPVGRDDHQHDHGNQQGDLPRVRVRGEPGQRQGEQDLVRCVRDRGEGVRGEDRQCNAFREQRFAELGAPELAAQQQPLADIGEIHHEWPCYYDAGEAPAAATPRLNAVHIVIMGCGRVGSSLARSLEKRGHTVAVIDLEPDAFRRLGPDFSGKTVKGVGFDREVLLEAGINDADGFAAVSSGDNSNILSARVVRETFAVDNVVARIYDPGRAEVYERLGIPTVATVRWTSDQMLRRLLPAGSEPQWRDPSGSVRLMEVHVDRSWVGRTIEQIEAATAARIPFLFRLGAGMVPKSSTVFQDGDLVYAAVADAQLAEVEATLGQRPTGE